jgi:hypothetical protein
MLTETYFSIGTQPLRLNKPMTSSLSWKYTTFGMFNNRISPGSKRACKAVVEVKQFKLFRRVEICNTTCPSQCSYVDISSSELIADDNAYFNIKTTCINSLYHIEIMYIYSSDGQRYMLPGRQDGPGF